MGDPARAEHARGAVRSTAHDRALDRQPALGEKYTALTVDAEKLYHQVDQYAYGPPLVRFADSDADQARAADLPPPRSRSRRRADDRDAPRPWRVPILAAVNAAIVRAADGLAGVRVLRMDLLFSPHGYSTSIPYRGEDVRVREPDGIHLNVRGLEIAAQVVAQRCAEAD